MTEIATKSGMEIELHEVSKEKFNELDKTPATRTEVVEPEIVKDIELSDVSSLTPTKYDGIFYKLLNSGIIVQLMGKPHHHPGLYLVVLFDGKIYTEEQALAMRQGMPHFGISKSMPWVRVSFPGKHYWCWAVKGS